MKDNILKGIGSYWPQFFQDRGVLEAFGTASAEMVSSVYMEIANLVLSLSHEEVPVYERAKWDLLTINASDDKVVDGKHRFPLPAAFNTKGLNSAPVILSGAVAPKAILRQGRDFTLVGAAIEFSADPFGVDGIPVREVGGDRQISLWCPIAEIDTNRVWRNYGHFVKRWKYSSPAYKDYVRGLFHARVFGPMVNRIESGLHLIAGLPVADGRGERVLAIANDGTGLIVRTDLRDYAIPSYANIVVNIGDALTPFQVLTDVITVTDYLKDPGWWRGRIGELPLEIGVTADIDRAFDQYLKYNTFLVRVNCMAFLEAISRGGGRSVLFETRTVQSYKKVSDPAQFILDGSYRLGAVVSEQFVGYAGGASAMSGFLKEFKPSYTYAFILFSLAFEIPAPMQVFYALRMNKAVDLPYPWDINKLDGLWKIGVDDKPLRLGEFVLNGNHVLSETVQGLVYRQLYYRIVTVSKLLRKFLENGEYIYAQLGESKLKVGCGGWKVGRNKILTISDAYFQKQIPMDMPPVYDTASHSRYPLWYPTSPAQIIGVHKLSGLKRLDGKWRVGAPVLPLKLGDFKVVREKSILQDFGKTINKERLVGVGLPKKLARHYRLGDYGLRLGDYWQVNGTTDRAKLNDGWGVGETKPFFGVDTLLLRDVEVNGAPGREVVLHTRHELPYPAQPSRLRSVHKLHYNRLDGKWRVGAPVLPLKVGDFGLGRSGFIPSELSMEIKKEASFGILKRLAGFNKLGIHKTRRLDGVWRVGAYYKVDGRWRLGQGNTLSAPRLVFSVLKIDGEWRVGTTRDVRLDGSWRLSDAQGAYIDITIGKIAA